MNDLMAIFEKGWYATRRWLKWMHIPIRRLGVKQYCVYLEDIRDNAPALYQSLVSAQKQQDLSDQLRLTPNQFEEFVERTKVNALQKLADERKQ
jgi:hypothetical protein